MNMSLVSMYASRTNGAGNTMAGRAPVSQQVTARPVSFQNPVGFTCYQQAIAELRGVMHLDCYVLTDFPTAALISFGYIPGVDQPGLITQHLWVATSDLDSLQFIGGLAQTLPGPLSPILTPDQIAAANINLVEIVGYLYANGFSGYTGVGTMDPAAYAACGPQVASSPFRASYSPAP